MSLRGPVNKPYDEARRAEFDGMGWDGMGYQKCPFISSYSVGIYIRYIPTYTCNKNLSPTFLWVSKFDVKLGVWVKNFKIRAGRRLFYFWI